MAEGTSNAGTWYGTSGSCIDVAEREHKFLNSEMKKHVNNLLERGDIENLLLHVAIEYIVVQNYVMRRMKGWIK